MPGTRGEKDPQPTLRDVAQRAHVSAMTVSRVLRDDPKVLPETAARVRAAVAELGYHRNEMARSLRLGSSTGLVGLVVTNLANPFYSRLALGVDAVVAGHGLKTVIGNTGHDLDSERGLVADLIARRVDGIVVVPADDDQRHLAAAADKGVPIVVASRPPNGFSADCVLVDDYGGSRTATRQLLDAGHRRIGFLGSPCGCLYGRRAIAGLHRRARRSRPRTRTGLRTARAAADRRGFACHVRTAGSAGAADGPVLLQQPQHHRCLPRDTRHAPPPHSRASTTSNWPTRSDCR